MIETIQNICEVFFEKVGVEVKIEEVKEEKEGIFFVRLQSDESSILIGNRGAMLADLKKILMLLVSKQTESNVTLHVEINNYLEEKDKKLYKFIDSKIALSKKLSKDIELPFFSSYERKKIHNYIGELSVKNVSTKSQGEGSKRRLYICYEAEKMSIDIDGIEI